MIRPVSFLPAPAEPAMTILILQFIGLALVVAIAGTFLARSADWIAETTGLGRLIVGSLLLAGVTSLPELSVDLSAVRAGLVDIAAGDLFGSSLMNLLILAGLDLAWRGERRMFSREAASHALSATLGIVLTGLAGAAVLTAGRLPPVTWLGVGGWSWALLIAYLLGARVLYLDQRISARAHREAAEEAEAKGQPSPERPHPGHLGWALMTFTAAAAALFFAGPQLSHVAGSLADRSGLGGTFVGTTLVAVTTSLPELVSSITALRLGAIDLAIGNAFGSNAFNMVLFVPLDAMHDGPLFASLSSAHAVTALAVIVATAIAVLGQLYQAKRRVPFFEPDALLMIFVLVGALGLVYRLS
jgi:cation:H+ antiporter